MEFFENEKINPKFLAEIRRDQLKGHLLTREDATIRELYCVGLIALCGQKFNVANEVLRYVGKILVAFSGEHLLYQYLVKALKADTIFWKDFYDLIRGQVAIQFCVDALMLCKNLSDKNVIDVSSLCSKLKVNYADCIAIVSMICQKDPRGLLMLKVKSPDVNLYDFLVYFFNYEDLLKKLTKKEGDIIELGKYKDKPIEWIVLGVGERDFFVLSKYSLGKKLYGRNGEKDIVWDKCKLRKWLNEDFFNSAFSELERQGITEIVTPAPWNPMGNKLDLDDSQDKLFLLSSVDADEFLDVTGRKCKNIVDGKLCKWWLRTPGFITNMPSTYVDEQGDIHNGGSYVCNIMDGNVSTYDDEYGVRPAMVIQSFVLV